MRISDWSSDVCSSDLLKRARSSADIQDSFCRSQSPSDHHPNPRVGFPEIRIIDPDRIVGSTHRLPHVSTITIQETPKRSATMPKRGLKKVLASGICTSPPSASAAKNFSASASSATVSDRDRKSTRLNYSH